MIMMKCLGRRLFALLFLYAVTSSPLYAGWGDLLKTVFGSVGR